MYAYPYTHPDMHPCTHPYTHTRLQVCLHMHIHVHMYIVNRVNAACNGSPAHLTAGSPLASTCRSQSILQTKGGFRMASRACKATAHHIASLSLVHPCPARLYIHFFFGVSGTPLPCTPIHSFFFWGVYTHTHTHVHSLKRGQRYCVLHRDAVIGYMYMSLSCIDIPMQLCVRAHVRLRTRARTHIRTRARVHLKIDT